jgi:hypothetical protein
MTCNKSKHSFVQDPPDPGDTSSENKSRIDPSEGLIKHSDHVASNSMRNALSQQAGSGTIIWSPAKTNCWNSSSSSHKCTSCNFKRNSEVGKASVDYCDSHPASGQSTESMIDPHDCGTLKIDSRGTTATMCPATSAETTKVPSWMEPYEVKSEEFPDLKELEGDVLLHTKPKPNDCSDWLASPALVLLLSVQMVDCFVFS